MEFSDYYSEELRDEIIKKILTIIDSEVRYNSIWALYVFTSETGSISMSCLPELILKYNDSGNHTVQYSGTFEALDFSKNSKLLGDENLHWYDSQFKVYSRDKGILI